MSFSFDVKIFPRPKKITLKGGKFVFPQGKNFVTYALSEHFDATLPPDGFRLEISSQSVTAFSQNRRALAYAKEVWSQLAKAYAEVPEGIPCLEVLDFPDVPVRGFMLDVSRGRVPKMSALFKLVDLLEKLRYNQFQLYIEHTFAFRDHERVWRDASPLTAEELRELDAYCLEKHIELVPNLNSFGHVERWLKHEPYKSLAECPDGFFHELFQMQRVAGTFAAGEETADFMGGLYREFLLNFSSKKFNIGGDEPWELGLGRSRALCESRGKRVVYIEHMMRLKKHAAACGKQIQFWGDVLLGEKGEIPVEFLEGTIPAIWGYDAGHPFDEQCARAREALKSVRNGSFYVVPGTSSWLSFGTRQANAFQNIREACASLKKYNGSGVLLTTWGDFGFHNCASADLLPQIFCAVEMWCGDASPDVEFFTEALRWLNREEAGYADLLLRFGMLDNFITKKIRNRSLIRELFFAQRDAVGHVLDGVPASEILAAKAEAECLLGELDNRNAPEFRLALEMTIVALTRADAFLRHDAFALKRIEHVMKTTLLDEFARVWRLENREGGLSESLSYFL